MDAICLQLEPQNLSQRSIKHLHEKPMMNSRFLRPSTSKTWSWRKTGCLRLQLAN
jgi:hypothetical protein